MSRGFICAANSEFGSKMICTLPLTERSYLRRRAILWRNLSREASPAIALRIPICSANKRGTGGGTHIHLQGCARPFIASHDLEDLVAVVDGRASLLEEMNTALPDLRRFIGEAIRSLLAAPRSLTLCQAICCRTRPTNAASRSSEKTGRIEQTCVRRRKIHANPSNLGTKHLECRI